MRYIDSLINAVTMYRIMLYFLTFLWLYVLVLSFFGLLPFSFLWFLISTFVILIVCYTTNKLFSLILKIPTNVESFYITWLILTFIITPAATFPGLKFMIIAAFLAMASKYIVAAYRKHIFNPAAIAVFITSVFSIGYASWWIGNVWTLPPLLIGGFLVLRKIKRFGMVFTFLCAFLVITFYFSATHHSDLIKVAQRIVFDSPILFFSLVMLVEPLTSPTTRRMQLAYGVLVGILSGSQFSIGPIYSTYETALIAGNVFAYLVGFKRRLVLTLLEKKQIGADIYEFVFSPDYNFSFSAGQYLEWTLSHKSPDLRGYRRYFTLASSPTEENVHIGVKINSSLSSSFKKALLLLPVGGKVYAGELSGDFTLPKNPTQKLVFIAGGIGVTPFRSLVRFLIDKRESRDIVLFYQSADPSEFVFKDVFDKGKSIGLKTVYFTKRIDTEAIKREVPDYLNRYYYLSGPNSMVESYRSLLLDLGIGRRRIITDYFPGY